MHVDHLEQSLELDKGQALVVVVVGVVYNSSSNSSKPFLSLFDFHKEAKAHITFPGPISSKCWAAELEPPASNSYLG